MFCIAVLEARPLIRARIVCPGFVALGAIGNTIAGAIGGAVGGQLLQQLVPTLASAASNVDIGALVGQIVGGGVGGAILTVLAGLTVWIVVPPKST